MQMNNFIAATFNYHITSENEKTCQRFVEVFFNNDYNQFLKQGILDLQKFYELYL